MPRLVAADGAAASTGNECEPDTCSDPSRHGACCGAQGSNHWSRCEFRWSLSTPRVGAGRASRRGGEPPQVVEEAGHGTGCGEYHQPGETPVRRGGEGSEFADEDSGQWGTDEAQQQDDQAGHEPGAGACSLCPGFQRLRLWQGSSGGKSTDIRHSVPG